MTGRRVERIEQGCVWLDGGESIPARTVIWAADKSFYWDAAPEAIGRIRAGEFLFPSCVIGAEPAPHDVRTHTAASPRPAR